MERINPIAIDRTIFLENCQKDNFWRFYFDEGIWIYRVDTNERQRREVCLISESAAFYGF